MPSRPFGRLRDLKDRTAISKKVTPGCWATFGRLRDLKDRTAISKKGDPGEGATFGSLMKVESGEDYSSTICFHMIGWSAVMFLPLPEWSVMVLPSPLLASERSIFQ